MVKGEIAHHEQFLILPQCLIKLSDVDALKGVTWMQGLTLSLI